MKSRSRTNKTSLQRIATRTALLLVFAVSLTTSGFVLSPTIITFDLAGAGTGAGQGTLGIAISPGGTITGYYGDSGYIVHGYVRARDGTFITFDAPGATTVPHQGTVRLASTRQVRSPDTTPMPTV
jgi:hypothetical protein